jgi:uncharacterized lipoprotein
MTIECSTRNKVKQTVVGDKGLIKIDHILIQIPLGVDVTINKSEYSIPKIIIQGFRGQTPKIFFFEIRK